MTRRLFAPLTLAFSALLITAAPSFAQESGLCGGLFSFLCPTPPPPPPPAPAAEPEPPPPAPVAKTHKVKKPKKAAAVKPQPAAAPQ